MTDIKNKTIHQVSQAKGRIKYRKYQVKQKLMPNEFQNSSTIADNGDNMQKNKNLKKTYKTNQEMKKQEKNIKNFSFFNIRKYMYGFAIKKFIRCLMKNGNQATAEKILLKSLLLVKRQYKPKLLKVFFLGALNNVKPLIELKSQQTYKSSRNTKAKAVPINSKRAYKLAIE